MSTQHRQRCVSSGVSGGQVEKGPDSDGGGCCLLCSQAACHSHNLTLEVSSGDQFGHFAFMLVILYIQLVVWIQVSSFMIEGSFSTPTPPDV